MTLPNPLPQVPGLPPRRRYTDGDNVHIRPLTEDELQDYLEDTDDLQETVDLWDKYSGIPGLLNTRPITEVQQQARRLAEIFFDTETGVWRYVIAGRRVPDFRIKMGVQRVANAVQRDLRDLTGRLVNGEISRQQWYDAMRATMKHEYRAAYLASIGGLENYDRSEISKFGWRMRPHYRWLNNFLAELESGKQGLNGFAVVRAGMYARAANAIYENERMRVAREAGYTEARRVLGPNESHCTDEGGTAIRPGCIELAGLGWVSISEMTPLGEALCLSNCLCGLEFRR